MYGFTCLPDGRVHLGMANWQASGCQKAQEEDRIRIEFPESPPSSSLSASSENGPAYSRSGLLC